MAVLGDDQYVFEFPQAKEETELFLCRCARPLTLPPPALIPTLSLSEWPGLADQAGCVVLKPSPALVSTASQLQALEIQQKSGQQKAQPLQCTGAAFTDLSGSSPSYPQIKYKVPCWAAVGQIANDCNCDYHRYIALSSRKYFLLPKRRCLRLVSLAAFLSLFHISEKAISHQ